MIFVFVWSRHWYLLRQHLKAMFWQDIKLISTCNYSRKTLKNTTKRDLEEIDKSAAVAVVAILRRETNKDYDITSGSRWSVFDKDEVEAIIPNSPGKENLFCPSTIPSHMSQTYAPVLIIWHDWWVIGTTSSSLWPVDRIRPQLNLVLVNITSELVKTLGLISTCL